MFHDKIFYLADVLLKKKAYDTKYSEAVTHPSTNFAPQGLTSVIRPDPMLSLWCGRRPSSLFTIINTFFKSKICISPSSFLKTASLNQNKIMAFHYLSSILFKL